MRHRLFFCGFKLFSFGFRVVWLPACCGCRIVFPATTASFVQAPISLSMDFEGSGSLALTMGIGISTSSARKVLGTRLCGSPIAAPDYIIHTGWLQSDCNWERSKPAWLGDQQLHRRSLARKPVATQPPSPKLGLGCGTRTGWVWLRTCLFTTRVGVAGHALHSHGDDAHRRADPTAHLPARSRPALPHGPTRHWHRRHHGPGAHARINKNVGLNFFKPCRW